MAKRKETPQEFAAKVHQFLRDECEFKRPPDAPLAYICFIAEPGNKEGAITYASNVPRSAVIEFIKEWLERNKPARGNTKIGELND